MHLHHPATRDADFGAGLHGWLWRKLLPDLRDDGNTVTLVGGGILDGLQVSPGHHVAIAGGGLGRAAFRLHGARRNWHFYWVRGPLSARRLRVGEALALTDGAALLREALTVRLPRRNCAAFIPDMRAAEIGAWPRCCDLTGIDYVDPRDHWRGVVTRLATARLVLAGSILGAIVADTYRVPWIAVTTKGAAADPFEWRDWCGSIGVDYRPVALPPSNFSEWLRGFRRPGRPFERSEQPQEAGGGFAETAAQRLHAVCAREPSLSNDAEFGRLTDAMIDRIGALRQDYRRGVFRPTVAATHRRPSDADSDIEPKSVAAWR